MKLADKIAYTFIFNYIRRTGLITVSNFYLNGFECDILSYDMNKDFATEYEIKISKQDFLNDAKKCRNYYNWRKGEYEKFGNSKYERLLKGEGVNKFYFIVPEELADKIEVPDFAGLYVYTPKANKDFKIVKRAKLLRKEKQPEKVLRNLLYKLDTRYYELGCRFKRTKYTYDEWRKDYYGETKDEV